MLINYNVQDLESVVRSFKNATGINLKIVNETFGNLRFPKEKTSNRYCRCIQNTEPGKTKCVMCDTALLDKCKKSGKAVSHVCHAGLIDIAIPIYFEDSIVGYALLGQIKTEADFEKIKGTLPDEVANVENLQVFYDELPLFDEARIKSIVDIATILVKYMLWEKYINPKSISTLENITEFIRNNIEKDLSIEYISKETHISKSSLYQLFHRHYNCTVSEFINEERIKKSCDLLLRSEKSIEDIALSVGYSSTTYFIRVFKKLKGMSPLQYRKSRDLFSPTE